MRSLITYGEYKFDIFSASDLKGYSLPKRIFRAIQGPSGIDARDIRKFTSKQLQKPKDLRWDRRQIRTDDTEGMMEVKSNLQKYQLYGELERLNKWLELNVPKFTMEELKRYIEAQQCPWCNDNAIYTILSIHTCVWHGISAYDLRLLSGLNRSSQICDPDFGAKRSDMHKKLVKNNKPFLDFDRHIFSGVKKPELRIEGHINHSIAQSTPEAKARSAINIRKVDRQKVLNSIPMDKRKEMGKVMYAANLAKHGIDAIRNNMRRAVTFQTTESKKIARELAKETMKNTFWNNPQKREAWKATLQNIPRKNRKITGTQKLEIKKLILNGVPYSEIAKQYNCSRSLISYLKNKEKLGIEDEKPTG